jgi:hypothetical protein
VTHPFLSDDWMTAAQAVRDRHAGAAAAFPFKLRINLVVTGVPFGPGEVHTFLDSSSGQLEMGIGQPEKPDATVTTDYDTARMLLVEQDQTAGMQAFMSGKIKVQGDATKLMALAAGQVDDTARLVAQEIKAITA